MFGVRDRSGLIKTEEQEGLPGVQCSKGQLIIRAPAQRFDAETESRARKVAELDEQDEVLKARQKKLLDLYYSDATPRGVLTSEQRKLSAGLAQAVVERECMGLDLSTRMHQVSNALD